MWLVDVGVSQLFADALDELNTATPEQVGVALVLHMQTEGNRFSPHNFQGSINNRYGNHSFTGVTGVGGCSAYPKACSGHLQMMLAVPDLGQTAGAWFILSRAAAQFDPHRDIERLSLERLMPAFMMHPKIRDASIEILKIGQYDARCNRSVQGCRKRGSGGSRLCRGISWHGNGS